MPLFPLFHRWLYASLIIAAVLLMTGCNGGFEHNVKYRHYLNQSDERIERMLSVDNEGVKEARMVHEAINLAYLAGRDEAQIRQWDEYLAASMLMLFRERLSVGDHVVVAGVFLDQRARLYLRNDSLRTALPSLRHLEECAVDLTFSGVFARYGEALAARDEPTRLAVLLEIQHALNCMNAVQTRAYSQALGKALSDWAGILHEARANLSYNTYTELKGSFLNPSLLVLDAIKYWGSGALFAALERDVAELDGALVRDRDILLFDIFSGRLIAFEQEVIAARLADLMHPYNIGTGQCGFGEMTAASLVGGFVGCGRGVSACEGQDGSDRETAFGVSHEALADNCYGAGGGEGEGGVGGGPVGGRGYGQCVIDTLLSARNAGNRGYANCMLDGVHGRQMADLQGHLTPLDGIYRPPECGNPLFGDGGLENGGEGDFMPDYFPELAEIPDQATIRQEEIDAQAGGVAETLGTDYGNCLVREAITERHGASVATEHMETCLQEAIDYVQNAQYDATLSGPAEFSVDSDGEGTIRVHNGKLHAAARRHQVGRAQAMTDALFHEAIHGAIYCAGRESGNLPDGIVDGEADHDSYDSAFAACADEATEVDGTTPGDPWTSLPQNPHEPDACSSYAEAMGDFMRCTGILDARSGVSGLDANGNVIEGGVLDPTFGRTYPQDPYSGMSGRGILSCNDEALATGPGGRVAAATDATSEACKVMLCESDQHRCPCIDGEADTLPFAVADRANLFGSALCEVSDFCLDDPHTPDPPGDPGGLPGSGPGCSGLTCSVDGFTGDFFEQRFRERVDPMLLP